MEVHHHTHHPKKWKEYFWEFFMLFLAVFCGFLAEYQLEHKIERDRAKEYIESLYADIKADQEVIAAHIAFTKSKVEILDSLIQLVYKEPNLKDSTKKLYYLARIAPIKGIEDILSIVDLDCDIYGFGEESYINKTVKNHIKSRVN